MCMYLVYIELSEIEDSMKNIEATWTYLHEGGLVPFMICMNGYMMKNVCIKFVNSLDE